MHENAIAMVPEWVKSEELKRLVQRYFAIGLEGVKSEELEREAQRTIGALRQVFDELMAEMVEEEQEMLAATIEAAAPTEATGTEPARRKLRL